MREIKFRGRPFHESEFVVGSLCMEGKESEWCVITDDKGVRHHVDSETVTQYTGYSDSCGREIYEGDIVRYEPKRKVVSLKFEIIPIFSTEFSTTDRKEAECIVKFEFGGFVLVKEDDEKFIQLLHRALSEDEENELKVIGNIYEGVNGNV